MNKILCIFFLIICFSKNTYAQTDSIQIKITKTERKPLIAAISSAIIPGGGQIYNRKYWKTPIVWGGLAGLGYWSSVNNMPYQNYKKALIYKTDNDPNTNPTSDLSQLNNEQLRTLRNTYRRRRDLAYIFMGIWYALNIVDATVDAHLSSFNVNENLSLQLFTNPINNGQTITNTGMYPISVTYNINLNK